MIPIQLINRTVSAFPISVGTSLALESIITDFSNKSIDPQREIPQVIDISKYDEVWINISTLFRNLLGSLNKDEYKKLHAKEFSIVLAEEMNIIDDLLKQYSSDKIKTIYFVCEYRDLQTKYRHAFHRVINTENQRIYKQQHDDTVKFLLKTFQGIRIFNSTLKPTTYSKIILVSHIAHDLLSYKNFSLLDLLESHTGVLKPRNMWFTKYVDGKNLSSLPFNKILLQVFGDNEHFKPYPITIRKEILDISTDRKWTPWTTIDKMLYDLNSLKDRYLLEKIKDM